MSDFKAEPGSALDVAQHEREAAAAALQTIQGVIDNLENEQQQAQRAIDTVDWESNLETVRAAFLAQPALALMVKAANKELSLRRDAARAADLKIEHLENPLRDFEREIAQHEMGLKRARVMAEIGDKLHPEVIPSTKNKLEKARQRLALEIERTLKAS